MRFLAVSLALAFCAVTTSALRFPIQQAKRSSIERRTGGASVTVSHASVLAAASDSDANDFDIDSVRDLIYLANITLGGTDYPVQLDTGSSDLWIKVPSAIPNSNQTSQAYNLTYGLGWAYGKISYASAEFAGISVPSQAFMDVSSAQNPALSYGAVGILGLGFTSLSTIDALVNSTDASTGRSFLYNMFLDNPSEPNFIAFSLPRTTDKTDAVDGSFSIGEYDPRYKQVANADPIPTFPENSPSRWSVLVDSIIVGQNQIPVTTSVAAAPQNKAVALLDSGTSYSYAPEAVCDAIYGGVEGASYSTTLGQWIVPCDAEIDMAIQINNQVYPIHPLDVSSVSQSDPSTCIGSWIPQAVTVGQGQFDWLMGDSVLRSLYSIYDFGDFDSSGHMGNPYMRLLSLVDPNEASADFHSVRGGTALTNITYNAANSSTSTTTVSLSDDVAQVLNKIGMFFPAMLAVMAFNALILLILVIVGVVMLCKRRKPKITRKNRGRGSPMPLNRISSSASSRHEYEPVSMALTEDTFVPPNPAFKGDTMRSKNRPSSSYSSTAVMSPVSPPEDEPFTPPGVPRPTFSSNVQPGDRPQSTFMPASPRPHSFMPPTSRPMSAYVPSANSSPIAPHPSSFAREAPTPSYIRQDPLEQTSRSPSPQTPIRSPQSPPSRPPPSPPNGGSPNNSSLFVPQTPQFRSNVQPGDRPRSAYDPSVASPEDELFAPPQAAFRGGGSRPRSMA